MRRVLLAAMFIVLLTLLSQGGAAMAGSPAPVSGDGDCNTSVNARDILPPLLHQSLILDTGCLASADVNCDAMVDARDALLIAQFVAGLPVDQGSCAPIGDPLLPSGTLDGSGLDFETFGLNEVGTAGEPSDNTDVIVGDSTDNLGRRAIIGFDISGLSGQVGVAVLTLTITESRKDQFPGPGTIDGDPPFTNPNLGDFSLVSVSEDTFLAQDASAYGANSIGNDPGVLIPAGMQPGATVKINVTSAVFSAIQSGANYVAFRIQAAVETDNGSSNNTFGFWSGDANEVDHRPKLTYALQ